MKNRMSRCAALIGTVLSLSSFAQDCHELSLYKNGSEVGKMENNGTFPELPEWSANWGALGEMLPPYIRLSGQKNTAGDWKGEFSFEALPANVMGGNLKVKLRSTQKGKVTLWLAGNFGKSASYDVDVDANRTYSLTIPVVNLLGTGAKKVSRVGIGLKNVPAYQYTSLFVDDIVFTCTQNTVSSDVNPENGGSEIEPENLEQQYVYSDISPASAVRESMFLEYRMPLVSAAYSEEKRLERRKNNNFSFVVSPSEQAQIEAYAKGTNLTGDESTKGWFRSLFLLDRNRLKDSVIANPKSLYNEAQVFAAGSDGKSMPLLLGNVDYGYEVCGDTLCDLRSVVAGRLLLAGFPVGEVRGSVIRLYYDPYFVTTNRNNLPQVEIYTGGVWKRFAPKSEMEIRFESAGKQKVQVRLSEGGLTIQQNLFVEVK